MVTKVLLVCQNDHRASVSVGLRETAEREVGGSDRRVQARERLPRQQVAGGRVSQRIQLCKSPTHVTA